MFPPAEGVCFAEKDYNLPKHPEMDVPNLHVRRNSPPSGWQSSSGVICLLTPLTRHTLVCLRTPQVIKLMQSFKSKEYVKEAFAWRHYYWCAQCPPACTPAPSTGQPLTHPPTGT